MIARARVAVEAGGILRELTSQPPLTIRRLHGADDDCCALCLVGSAAGPLPGDDLQLAVELGDRARASLVSAGASIALGRVTAGARRAGSVGERDSARVHTRLELGVGAELVGRAAPFVVTAGGNVELELRIRLGAGAALSWREVVVLGRSGEEPGAVRISWDCERAGWPLLRQVTDLREAARRRWPGTIAGARVLATCLRVGPHVQARTIAVGPTSAVQALALDAELITVLAADTASAERELALLIGEAGPDARPAATVQPTGTPLMTAAESRRAPA